MSFQAKSVRAKSIDGIFDITDRPSRYISFFSEPFSRVQFVRLMFFSI